MRKNENENWINVNVRVSIIASENAQLLRPDPTNTPVNTGYVVLELIILGCP